MSAPVPSAKCPICARPTVTEFRPFCSRRCADIDLQRWLTGRYRVPAEEDQAPREGPGEDPGEED